MRTLLLMRHAKSSWKDEDLDDRDRPLTKRGKREALHMGPELRTRDALPDVIVSSPAKRARSTARRIAKSSAYAGEIVCDEHLYFEGLDPYYAALASLSDSMMRVMLIGHNPLCEELLRNLTGQVLPMGTAAIACIDLPIDAWADVSNSTQGTLRFLIDPQSVEAVDSKE